MIVKRSEEKSCSISVFPSLNNRSLSRLRLPCVWLWKIIVWHCLKKKQNFVTPTQLDFTDIFSIIYLITYFLNNSKIFWPNVNTFFPSRQYLCRHEWEEIIWDNISGTYTQRNLAKDFGIVDKEMIQKMLAIWWTQVATMYWLLWRSWNGFEKTDISKGYWFCSLQIFNQKWDCGIIW